MISGFDLILFQKVRTNRMNLIFFKFFFGFREREDMVNFAEFTILYCADNAGTVRDSIFSNTEQFIRVFITRIRERLAHNRPDGIGIINGACRHHGFGDDIHRIVV